MTVFAQAFYCGSCCDWLPYWLCIPMIRGSLVLAMGSAAIVAAINWQRHETR